MKIVRPIIVTNLNLTTSNITSPETAAPLYVGATTYALGDRVTQETAANPVTMTLADPTVITMTAHEIPVGGFINFTTTGAMYTGITAGTQYVVKSVTTNTFTIAVAATGIVVRTTGSQSGTHTCVYHIQKTYVSLQAANTGRNPRAAASAAWWQVEGDSNRWRMFDGSVTSQTTGATISIILTFNTNSQPDTLALLNIRGTSCVVKIWDTSAATYVHNQTYSLIASGITPQETVSDLLLVNLTQTTTADGWIEVVLSDAVAANMCAIGALVFGEAVDAGATEYGASVGIQDFSVIEVDSFGIYNVVERAFSKTASFQVMVPVADVPRVFRILSEQRAKKCLYIGSDSYTSTAIYGFPSDWTILISYPTYSILNIELKGLT